MIPIDEYPEYDLEKDFRASPKLMARIKDNRYAVKFYSSITNMRWLKKDVMPILKDEGWTASFRQAGAIIADLRGEGETYLDFYCSGPEGDVDDEVKADLDELGWFPKEWDFP